jgi:glycosyltransferase involved in cell wall biosynthesis
MSVPGFDLFSPSGQTPAYLAERQAASRTIEQHFAIFRDLVERTQSYLARGKYDAAAVHAEIAANYAMSNHAGLFTSPQLEGMLLTIGQALGPRAYYARSRVERSAAPGRVLHVLTRAFGIGGDSRMVWRWMRQDSGRSHSLVLTRQGGVPVPPLLGTAVAAAGGRVDVLNQRRGGLCNWAIALRRLATAADVVVLHVHPYDVVPVLAFADKRNTPPIVFVDHADHAFWVGASVTDVLASMRDSGANLALARRGFSPERITLLPIVLGPAKRTLSRSEAKARLGLAPDAIVLLSIARPHKYTPFDERSLLSALLPVLAKYRQAQLLVIGPEDKEPWTSSRLQTQGRVRALGMREDTEVFYQAADIYVDSFPIVSITSLLEAGSYGTPLVSLCPHEQGSVLCADTPALARCLIQASSVEACQAELASLIEDGERRQRLGLETSESIGAIHSGSGWQRSLETAYGQVRTPQLRIQPAPLAEKPYLGELDQLLVRLFKDEPGLDQIVQYHLRVLPLEMRLRQWARALVTRRAVSPGLLLPEWLGAKVEKHRLQRSA